MTLLIVGAALLLLGIGVLAYAVYRVSVLGRVEYKASLIANSPDGDTVVVAEYSGRGVIGGWFSHEWVNTTSLPIHVQGWAWTFHWPVLQLFGHGVTQYDADVYPGESVIVCGRIRAQTATVEEEEYA